MKAILALNNLSYIGLDNKIPWKSKEDLKHFKELTMGASLLVGYNTAQGLPPLKGREIIVYDRNNNDVDYTKIDWCIGGKKTYEMFCHLFTELHISYINDNTIGDVFAPELKNLNEECKIFRYNFKID